MNERITDDMVEAVARAIEPETFDLPRINLNRPVYERAFARARRAIEAVAALQHQSSLPVEAEGWQQLRVAYEAAKYQPGDPPFISPKLATFMQAVGALLAAAPSTGGR